jgi:hypothetical protein
MVDPKDNDDLAIEDFLQDVIDSGKKLNGEILKYHFGSPLFRFQFTGMLFFNETHPTLTKAQTGPYNVTYQASVDYWEKVKSSA